MFDGLEVIAKRKLWEEKKLKEEKGIFFESMHCYI